MEGNAWYKKTKNWWKPRIIFDKSYANVISTNSANKGTDNGNLNNGVVVNMRSLRGWWGSYEGIEEHTLSVI